MKIFFSIAFVLVSLGLITPVSAQVSIEGSRSAAWVPAGQYEYNNDRKPYHDIQYDAVPNRSIYYQVDIGATFFLTGTGNNYSPASTPQIPMSNLAFWGVEKGNSASYDSNLRMTVDSPVKVAVLGGNFFNNGLREIGVTTQGVDRKIFTLDGWSSVTVSNEIIDPGVWTWYAITEDGSRKEGNRQVVAPFVNQETGQIYLAFNSYSIWGFSGLFVRLDSVQQ